MADRVQGWGSRGRGRPRPRERLSERSEDWMKREARKPRDPRPCTLVQARRIVYQNPV